MRIISRSVINWIIIFYIANIIVKYLYYTAKIFSCKNLINKVNKYSVSKNSNDVIVQLYSFIDKFCSNVGVKAYQDPYGVNEKHINKNTLYFQKHLISSLNEVIGIYKYRRRYCYILIPIKNNNKSLAFFKFIIDAFFKVFGSVIIDFILNQIYMII